MDVKTGTETAVPTTPKTPPADSEWERPLLESESEVLKAMIEPAVVIDETKYAETPNAAMKGSEAATETGAPKEAATKGSEAAQASTGVVTETPKKTPKEAELEVAGKSEFVVKWETASLVTPVATTETPVIKATTVEVGAPLAATETPVVERTPVVVAKPKSAYELLWEMVQQQPISTFPQWSPDEELDIQKAAKTVKDAIEVDESGRISFQVPLQFFLDRFHSVEMLACRPYHARILVHLVDFNASTTTERDSFEAVVNKYRRMSGCAKFADYFERVFEEHKKQYLEAFRKGKELARLYDKLGGLVGDDVLQIRPSSKVEEPSKAPSTEVPKQAPASGSTVPPPETPPVVPEVPKEVPNGCPFLSLSEIWELIQKEYPPKTDNEWTIKEVLKVEQFADSIRSTKCAQITMNAASLLIKKETPWNHVVCLFSLVDVQSAHTTDAYRIFTGHNQLTDEMRKYLKNRYAQGLMAKKSPWTVSEIWEWLQTECAKIQGPVDEASGQLNVLVESIRPKCNPIEWYDFVMQYSLAKLDNGTDMNCIFGLFNLIDFTTSTYSEWQNRFDSFRNDRCRNYFKKRYDELTGTVTVMDSMPATVAPKLLTPSETWKLIKEKCPTSGSWARSEMEKVEQFADSIRTKCEPIPFAYVDGIVSGFDEIRTAQSVDHCICLFNLVDLKSVSETEFNKFRSNSKFGAHFRSYLTTRYELVRKENPKEVPKDAPKEPRMSVSDIWTLIQKECPRADSWSRSEMQKLEKFANSIRSKCGPVAIEDVLRYAKMTGSDISDSALTDFCCCLFNLVDLDTADSNVFAQFPGPNMNYADYFFTRFLEKKKEQRKGQSNGDIAIDTGEIYPSFTNMETDVFVTMIEAQRINAPNWSTESMKEIEAIANKLVKRHGLVQWTKFRKSREEFTSLDHVCLAFNVVDFKSAPTNNVQKFIEKESSSYLGPFGKYLQLRYTAICEQLEPPAPVVTPTPPASSVPSGSGMKCTWSELLTFVEKGPRTDGWRREDQQKWEAYANEIRPKVGSLTLDEFAKLKESHSNYCDGRFAMWNLVDFQNVTEDQARAVVENVFISSDSHAYCMNWYRKTKESKEVPKEAGVQAKPPVADSKPTESTPLPKAKKRLEMIVDLLKKCPQGSWKNAVGLEKLRAYVKTIETTVAKSFNGQKGKITMDEFEQLEQTTTLINSAPEGQCAWLLLDFCDMSRDAVETKLKQMRFSDPFQEFALDHYDQLTKTSVPAPPEKSTATPIPPPPVLVSAPSVLSPPVPPAPVPTTMDLDKLGMLLLSNSSIRDWSPESQKKWEENADNIRPQVGSITLEQFQKLNVERDDALLSAWTLIDFTNASDADVDEAITKKINRSYEKSRNYCLKWYNQWKAKRNAPVVSVPTTAPAPVPVPVPTTMDLDKLDSLLKEFTSINDWSLESQKKWEANADKIRPQVGSITLDQFRRLKIERDDCILSAWTLIDFTNVSDADINEAIKKKVEYSQSREYCRKWYNEWKAKRNAPAPVVSVSTSAPVSMTPVVPTSVSPPAPPKMDIRDIIELIKKVPPTVSMRQELDEYAKKIRPQTGSITLDQFKVVSSSCVPATHEYIAWKLVDFKSAPDQEISETPKKYCYSSVEQWCLDAYNEWKTTSTTGVQSPPNSKWDEIVANIKKFSNPIMGWSDAELMTLETFGDAIRSKHGSISLDQFKSFMEKDKSGEISYCNWCYIAWTLVDFQNVTAENVQEINQPDHPSCNTYRLKYFEKKTKKPEERAKPEEPKKAPTADKVQTSSTPPVETASATSTASPIPPSTRMDWTSIQKLIRGRADSSETSLADLEKHADEIRPKTGLITLEQYKSFISSSASFRDCYVAWTLVDFKMVTIEMVETIFSCHDLFTRACHIEYYKKAKTKTPAPAKTPEVAKVTDVSKAPEAMGGGHRSTPSTSSATDVAKSPENVAPKTKLTREAIFKMVDEKMPMAPGWTDKDMEKLDQYAETLRPLIGVVPFEFVTTSNDVNRRCVLFNLVDFRSTPKEDIEAFMTGGNTDAKIYYQRRYEFHFNPSHVEAPKATPSVEVKPKPNVEGPPKSVATQEPMTVMASMVTSFLTGDKEIPKPDAKHAQKDAPKETPKDDPKDVPKKDILALWELLLVKCPSTDDAFDPKSIAHSEKVAAELKAQVGFIKLKDVTLVQMLYVRSENANTNAFIALLNLLKPSPKIGQRLLRIFIHNRVELVRYIWTRFCTLKPEAKDRIIATCNMSTIRKYCQWRFDAFVPSERTALLTRLKQERITKTAAVFLDHLNHLDLPESEMTVMDVFIMPNIVQWSLDDKSIVSQIVRLCRQNKWNMMLETLLNCVSKVFPADQVGKWRKLFIHPDPQINCVTRLWRKLRQRVCQSRQRNLGVSRDVAVGIRQADSSVLWMNDYPLR